jgi:two-component system sensor histidine kinase KdpD
MAIPVVGTRNRILGCLVFGHARAGAFTARHEELAIGLSSWAAVALDNARLYAEAQAMQGELLQANRAKDEFLGLISHELRSPTTTIYGGARLLASHYPTLDPQDRNDLIGSIAAESRRLVRLIDNLLAIARLDLGKEIETSAVAMDELATETSASFGSLHKDRNLDLSLEEGLPLVAGDSGYLEQVLENLLSNAVKYSPDGSPVEVAVRRDDEMVTVSVADRGRGVLPDELEVIFESFYRSNRTAENASGYGLGLTVCKRLVNQQGGRIWAENRREGGLRVSFSLPVWKAAATNGESADEAAPEEEAATTL